MSLITRLEKLEKRAANMETEFDMKTALTDARKVLADFKLQPPLPLMDQIADVKARIARNEKDATDAEDWLERELASIHVECGKRYLAILAADLDLLEPLLTDPEGPEAHG